MKKFYTICFLCLILLLPVNSMGDAQDSPLPNNSAVDMGNTPAPDKTISTEEMTDIYDIKPPLIFGVNPVWVKYVFAFILAIFFLVLFFLIYRYWNKRRHPVETLMPSVSPEEKAYGMLRKIKFLMNADGKEFYFRLSAIFRSYIQDRYGVLALEMTTEELLPHIKKLAIEEQMKMDTRSFILSSDPVKFTDMAAGVDDMEYHYLFVRTFIEKTTPIPTVMDLSSTNKCGE